MKITYELTPADLFEVLHRRKGLLYAGLTFLTLVGLVTIAVAFRNMNSGRQSLIDALKGYAPFTLFWLVFSAFIYLQPRLMLRNNPMLSGTFTADIDESGIEVVGAHSSSRFDWAAFRKARESEHLFVLYPSDKLFLAFPKRAFDQADLEGFRALLRDRVSSGK